CQPGTLANHSAAGCIYLSAAASSQPTGETRKSVARSSCRGKARGSMHTFQDMNRRRFLGTTAGVLAALRAETGWSLQATTPQNPRGGTGPHWRPTLDLLRSLPRLLELASVPGLGLATVDEGRIFTRGFGRASLDPRR